MLDRFFAVEAENDRYARRVRSSAGLAVIHSSRDDPAHLMQALLGLGDRQPDMLLHMLLRFGHAPPMPRSLRRPVAAVIDPRL